MNHDNPPFRATYSGPLRIRDLALECKITSVILWILLASLKITLDFWELDSLDRPRDVFVRDWENPAYGYRICIQIIVLLVVALLAVVPNRWLVSSRKVFGTSLMIALIPLYALLIQNWRADPFLTLQNYFDPGALAIALFISCPLAMSITLSFWRKQRGEKIGYA